MSRVMTVIFLTCCAALVSAGLSGIWAVAQQPDEAGRMVEQDKAGLAKAEASDNVARQLLREPGEPGEQAGNGPRFVSLNVVVDSGDKPLAAWQLEFSAKQGMVSVVGVGNGQHPAYDQPPHYDPRAMRQDRIIMAAYSTAEAEKLPTGKTVVATINLMIEGPQPAVFESKMVAAADAGGERLNANLIIEEGN